MPDARGPRDRMVYSAAQLIRRQGPTATGIRDVVAHASAPRGSVQHYFPHGKRQLVGEAVRWAGAFAGARAAEAVAAMRAPTPSRLLDAMVRQWVEEYRGDGFALGCPMAATAVDCAATGEVSRADLLAALRSWRDPVIAALIEMGVPPRRAGDLASLMISAVEGAIVLARIEESVRPLTTVARELGPLLDAAVAPASVEPRPPTAP